MTRRLSARERLGLRVLGVVFLLAVAVVGLIQLFGGPVGSPCRDSYDCRGFLIAGTECVEDLTTSYCSRYCRIDTDCPAAWRCDRAYPTVLAVSTSARGLICIRPSR
jgi:hypothetical protein